VHPKPEKAREGRHLQRLVPDPTAAPVVRRIFAMYVEQRFGARAIAQQLTDDGVPCPSAHDPGRNRHRAGNGGAWSRSAVRAILGNPRYLGHEVWGRVHGHEVLIDPDDVGLGYSTVMRPVDASRWVWSARPVHEAIVDADVFAAAQEQLGLGRDRTTDRRPPTKRAYVLRGRIWCAACGRKMEADTSAGLARYRCRLSGGDYARNEALDRSHPRSAAVSERRVAATIDGWLAGLFDAEHAEGDDTGLDGGRRRAGPGDGGPSGAGPGTGAGRGREAGALPGGARRWGRPGGGGRLDRGGASGAGVGGARPARRHAGGADG
jgi:hypothetical protein